MTQKQRYQGIIEWFEASMPDARTELHYDSEFHLLVAVILSAQCTDRRVNMITPALFGAFPTAESMASTCVDQIKEYIKSISYPNNKSRLLLAASKALAASGGELPRTLEGLLELPGVGRKTANVMLAVAFGEQAMPVDTHVHRVSQRLGLVPRGSTVLAVEKALTRNIPHDKLTLAHHWLILHGRYVCKARRPDCLSCGLISLCASKGKF